MPVIPLARAHNADSISFVTSSSLLNFLHVFNRKIHMDPSVDDMEKIEKARASVQRKQK